MAIELLSLLSTFENSTKCDKIPFDSDSYKKGLLRSIIESLKNH